MAKEIERKFLINLSELGSLESLENGTTIKQGYLSVNKQCVVRVRLSGNQAFLTLKGANKGITRTEFEYEIPVKDAEQIIKELCAGPVIEKTRYLVVCSGHTWEVDIFHGDNAGLAIAEIELSHEAESFEIPPWTTSEVSADPKYYNSNLLSNPYKSW